MLFADGIDTFKAFAVPIGIGLAVLIILLVPSLRRSVLNSFKGGHEAGERLRGEKKPPEDQDGPSR